MTKKKDVERPPAKDKVVSTRVPDDITEELRRFGRAGVPLVLVYPQE